jgi:hypothetical protein
MEGFRPYLVGVQLFEIIDIRRVEPDQVSL